MEHDYEYIVIGGGICGFEIGALCSTIGKVLLLEKTSSIGGRARVVDKNGFKLDWGGHPVRFGKKSSIAQTMRDIGVDIEFINPRISYAYLANGERHIFPSGIKGIIKTKMISKLQLVKVVIDLLKRMKKDKTKLLETSFKQYFEENKIDDNLKKFLYMSTAAMQVNPFLERSSIGEFLLNMLQVLKKKSVFYPRGGWNEFFSNLKDAIEKNGEVRLNSEVSKIIVEDKKIIGVEVGGKIIRGKTIISTIPVQQVFSILEESLAPSDFVKKCKDLRQTAGICIDFCLSKVISDETLVFFEDPAGFGVFPSNMSPEVAPQDKMIMNFFFPTDISVIKNEDERKKFHEKIRNQIIKIYPEIENEGIVELERPLFLEMVDGVEIAVDQHSEIRPMSDDLDIENLYLTGDSIGGEGAGGDVGHTSVRECFKSIVNGKLSKDYKN